MNASLLVYVPSHSTGCDRVTLEHGCTRLRFPAHHHTEVSSQTSMDLFPDASLCPLAERQGNRPPVREIMWPHTPGTATARHVLPLTMARRSLSCDRPPGLAARITGCRMAHAFSVTSEVSTRRSLPHLHMMLLLASLLGDFHLLFLLSLGSVSPFCTSSQKSHMADAHVVRYQSATTGAISLQLCTAFSQPVVRQHVQCSQAGALAGLNIHIRLLMCAQTRRLQEREYTLCVALILQVRRAVVWF